MAQSDVSASSGRRGRDTPFRAGLSPFEGKVSSQSGELIWGKSRQNIVILQPVQADQKARTYVEEIFEPRIKKVTMRPLNFLIKDKFMNYRALVLILGFSLLGGCGEKMPEINDENCKDFMEKAKKIKDTDIRQKYMGQCYAHTMFRNSFKKSNDAPVKLFD